MTSGAFVLRDLPPGRYGVAAWHEAPDAATRARQAVEVAAGAAPLTITLDVAPRARATPVRGGARSDE